MDDATVVLILGDFDGDLPALVARHPIWIQSTPRNDGVIAGCRAALDLADDLDRLSAFSVPGDPMDDLVDRILDIDLHHGVDAAGSGWTTIHVLGAPASALDLDEVCAALGFPIRIEPDGDATAFSLHRVATTTDR